MKPKINYSRLKLTNIASNNLQTLKKKSSLYSSETIRLINVIIDLDTLDKQRHDKERLLILISDTYLPRAREILMAVAPGAVLISNYHGKSRSRSTY